MSYQFPPSRSSGAYVPPHLRNKDKDDEEKKPTPAKQQENPSVSAVLKSNGWVQGGSGNYYYPKKHPHIHIQVKNGSKEYDSNKNIYSYVTMMCISDGGQGDSGSVLGGGVNFYPTPNPNREKKLTAISLLKDDKARFKFDRICEELNIEVPKE